MLINGLFLKLHLTTAAKLLNTDSQNHIAALNNYFFRGTQYNFEVPIPANRLLPTTPVDYFWLGFPSCVHTSSLRSCRSLTNCFKFFSLKFRPVLSTFGSLDPTTRSPNKAYFAGHNQFSGCPFYFLKRLQDVPLLFSCAPFKD